MLDRVKEAETACVFVHHFAGMSSAPFEQDAPAFGGFPSFDRLNHPEKFHGIFI